MTPLFIHISFGVWDEQWSAKAEEVAVGVTREANSRAHKTYAGTPGLGDNKKERQEQQQKQKQALPLRLHSGSG